MVAVSSLSWRVVVVVAASSLVGLLSIDIAFLLWAERRYEAESRVELRLALVELAHAADLATDPRAAMSRVAAAHDVVLSLVGDAVTPLQTAPVALPDDGVTSDDRGLFQHEALPVTAAPFRQAIASRSRAAALDAALATQRWSTLVLGGAGVLMVLLTTLFLRRSLFAPLGRLTELVRGHELDALDRFSGGGDALSSLGHAILALTRTLGDDRARIATQLHALEQAHHELEDTQHLLVRSERLAVVGQLAAGLAHEVGNPLAVLSGYVDVLRTGDVAKPERDEALARMSKELTRIHGTLRNLLDFSRVSADASGEGDLGLALEHVRGLVAPQLKGARLDSPPPPPVIVGIGTDALTQLLLNLVLNAVDAVEREGRITVVVEAPGAPGVPDDRVLLHVDDSGPGVPPELRRRIFEPFFTTKPAGKGTGLGLAVCERIVAGAGGDLRVGESPLGGARFSVTLPARRAG